MRVVRANFFFLHTHEWTDRKTYDEANIRFSQFFEGASTRTSRTVDWD